MRQEPGQCGAQRVRAFADTSAPREKLQIADGSPQDTRRLLLPPPLAPARNAQEHGECARLKVC